MSGEEIKAALFWALVGVSVHMWFRVIMEGLAQRKANRNRARFIAKTEWPDDITTSAEFKTAGERAAFRDGVIEGTEQATMALMRRGYVPSDFCWDHSENRLEKTK